MNVSSPHVEDLLRELAPQVLGTLLRRFGAFDTAEDAVQEALLAAAQQWPDEGLPDNPRGWLITVASRRLTDQFRSDEARRRREIDSFAQTPVPAAVSDEDDTLTLLFLCCHPALSASSQVALTLRAVGGLSTSEIAGAFFVPEATMGQRISRAKQQIKNAGARFEEPSPDEWADRLKVVLTVLYLIFNEGYTATSGPDLHRVELSAEAIRLTRMLHGMLPLHGEITGLLALMLLTDARRPARSTVEGELIPLADQDRSRWNHTAIGEGIALLEAALPRSQMGQYQVQAAIAAVHAEATSARDTDWVQIVGLYRVLVRLAPNPMTTLNLAIAVSMADGPMAGLALLSQLDSDERMQRNHRLSATRAHLMEMAGDFKGARTHYLKAARLTTSLPEQRYLFSRAAKLSTPN